MKIGRLPPVATSLPLSLRFVPGRAEASDVGRLESRVALDHGADAAAAFSSGRAGLARMLEQIALTRSGRGVLVPAYTCYTVASAIVRAGLLIYPTDLHPETLDFNYRNQTQPPPEDVFAVLSPGLFGLPPDLARLGEVCRAHRLFFIEDAAQTLGATVDGRPAGSFGDLSLFSFGRGKPLGAIGGGVVATRGEALSAVLERARLAPPAGNRVRAMLTALAGGAATNPLVFAWLRLLPFVTIGRSVFDTQFGVAGLDPPRARMILDGLARLAGVVERRQQVATMIEARLSGVRGVIIPRVRAGIVGAALRFPVIFEDSADRDAALFRLVGRGLGASPMYPKPVYRIDKARPHVRMDLGPFPGAEKIARGLVTLPTHNAVNERDVDDIAAVIREVTSAGSARVWD